MKYICIAFLIFYSGSLYAQNYGNALSFDGIDDYVYIGDDTTLDVNTYTLAAWVHPYSYTNIGDETRMEILEKAGSYWMNISSVSDKQNRTTGTVRVGGFYGLERKWRYIDSNYVVPLNEWTHVACTYDTNDLLLYINGKLDTLLAIPENYTYVEPLKLAIGCKYGADNVVQAQFHGMIDEVNIWDSVLTDEQIYKLYTAPITADHSDWDHLVSYWKFDEDSLGALAGMVLDSKGHNHSPNYGAAWVVNHFTAAVARNAPLVAADQYRLLQNYPNPFNPVTTIGYELIIDAHVELTIYNSIGQQIASLVSAQQSPGFYQVNWNASEYPSGLYYYIMTTDAKNITSRKMMLIK